MCCWGSCFRFMKLLGGYSHTCCAFLWREWLKALDNLDNLRLTVFFPFSKRWWLLSRKTKKKIISWQWIWPVLCFSLYTHTGISCCSHTNSRYLSCQHALQKSIYAIFSDTRTEMYSYCLILPVFLLYMSYLPPFPPTPSSPHSILNNWEDGWYWIWLMIGIVRVWQSW